MKSKLTNDQGITLVVVLMVMAILLSVIGAGLLFSGINTKITSNYQTGTRAFYAADIGINAVANTSTPNSTFTATPVSLGNNLCYRFGRRDGTVPALQPITKSAPNYAIGSGTPTYGAGTSGSSYNFYQYRINVTGTFSPTTGCPSVNNETAAREVEAQVQYGPN
jgi:hypothetical protein